MSEVRALNSWRDELASLVEDTGIRYVADPIGISSPAFETTRAEYVIADSRNDESVEPESLTDQVKGFVVAWGEILLEFGRGCRDIVQQCLFTEDSYIPRKLRGPCAKVSGRLRFLNEFLPEDRDPVYAWPVIFFVFILALAVINVDMINNSTIRVVKKVRTHPPSAIRFLLPDGRNMGYHERGVLADRARFSIIAPHSFLSSRLAGIPGVKTSLLEEFGVRLVTYDLPGFGESDPHPSRNLNSSASDMVYLADAVGINDKFWVLGYSSGAMHAWGALHYIPNRIAGAIMVAPMVNPYEPRMTKEEMKQTWEKWRPRRKLTYFLARKFPKLLSYFFGKFLSGNHDRVDNWLSLSLGKRDELVIEEPQFEDFWYRDVEESIRQKNLKPFIEEAALQVSNWGFSLGDLQVQKKCQRRGILPWLKFIYSDAECELTGYQGPIHIWQGMGDQVVPPSMTDYAGRVLPAATVHKLTNEGHFSFFFFCHECHRQMFSTVFGISQGPRDIKEQMKTFLIDGDTEEAASFTNQTAD